MTQAQGVVFPSDEDMSMAIDAMRLARRQAKDTLVLASSVTDEGEEFLVIRDALAEPGARVLWKKALAPNVPREAEDKLEWLRDQRVVLAVTRWRRLGREGS